MGIQELFNIAILSHECHIGTFSQNTFTSCEWSSSLIQQEAGIPLEQAFVDSPCLGLNKRAIPLTTIEKNAKRFESFMY